MAKLSNQPNLLRMDAKKDEEAAAESKKDEKPKTATAEKPKDQKDSRANELDDMLSGLTSALDDFDLPTQKTPLSGSSKLGTKSAFGGFDKKKPSPLAKPAVATPIAPPVEEKPKENPKCSFCKEEIEGKNICINENTYFHPNHFRCQKKKKQKDHETGSEEEVTCDKLLGVKTFFLKNDIYYCPNCYHEEFSPRCAFCTQPIIDVRASFSF